MWIEIVLVGITGLILSVLLHELFHIMIHLDKSPHIGLFSDSGAIVEILVWLPSGYDLQGEEIVAYTITLTVILVTIMRMFKIHDASDRRSSSDILFPKDKRMQKMNPTDFLDLAERADPGQVVFTPKNQRKPRR